MKHVVKIQAILATAKRINQFSVFTETFKVEIPRDRNGSFDPQLIKKGEKQLAGFDERIVSLYARGMSTRDIQAHFVSWKERKRLPVI